MDKKEFLMSEVKARYDWLQKEHPELKVFCVLLRGSQNYGVDTYTETYTSDVDVFAMCVPTLKQLVRNQEVKAAELHYLDDSHVDTRDLRAMVTQFKKANASMLELLFTEYYYVPSEYEKEFEAMRAMATEMAKANMSGFLKATYGSVLQKRKALCHTYPVQKTEVERHGYACKQAHHLLRYCFMLQQVMDGVPFEKALKFNNNETVRKFLLDLKTNRYDFPCDMVVSLCDQEMEYTKSLMSDFEKEHKLEVNDEVFETMYLEVVEPLVRKALK